MENATQQDALESEEVVVEEQHSRIRNEDEVD